MKISKIVLFVLLTSVSFSYAQNKLMGKVTDYKNKPVVGAKIYLDSIYSNVETNKQGSYLALGPAHFFQRHGFCPFQRFTNFS